MKFLFASFLFLLVLGSGAQSVEISNATKLPAKTSKFKIVGKNNDGIVVRLYGSEDVISVYDNSLRLVTNKIIDYKNEDGQLQYIMLNKTGAVIFYLEQQKKYSVLLAQPVNSKFIEIGKAVSIDTIYDRKELVSQNLRFKASVDQSYLMVYYPFFSGSKVESIKFMCLDRTLNMLYNKTVPLNRDEAELEQSKALIDNKGNAFLILKPEIKGEGSAYNVLHLSNNGGFAFYNLLTEKEVFDEPLFEIDNKNGNMVMSAFYDDKKRTNENVANGFLYSSFDPDNGIALHTNYTEFSNEFIAELTGRENITNKSLYTFTIRKILLRNDGGILLMAESYIKDSREQSVPLGVQPGYNSYRSTDIFQFNDIVTFSLNPSGEMEWHSVLRKKQASEDDNGIYSSYLMLNEKDKLHFLYLDDPTITGSLNEYSITSTGTQDKKLLTYQEEQDIMLMPKLGKQTAPDEVVLPSYKGGSLRLVKITF